MKKEHKQCFHDKQTEGLWLAAQRDEEACRVRIDCWGMAVMHIFTPSM